MEYIDISVPLSANLAASPKAQPFTKEFLRTLEKDDAEVSRIVMETHTGTHIDAPRHFIKGGRGVDQIDLSKLNGPCKVIDCAYVEFLITLNDLKDFTINPGDRILIKTRNSDYIDSSEYRPDYVSLSLEAAQYLANCEIALVGTDYFGIEAKGSPGHPVHKALLKHEIAVLEGVNLKSIEPGDYSLTCLPLRIVDADGSPCRALLLKS